MSLSSAARVGIGQMASSATIGTTDRILTISLACPNANANGSQGSTSRKRAASFGTPASGGASSGACYKCGEEGHFSNGALSRFILRMRSQHFCSMSERTIKETTKYGGAVNVWRRVLQMWTRRTFQQWYGHIRRTKYAICSCSPI